MDDNPAKQDEIKISVQTIQPEVEESTVVNRSTVAYRTQEIIDLDKRIDKLKSERLALVTKLGPKVETDELKQIRIEINRLRSAKVASFKVLKRLQANDSRK